MATITTPVTEMLGIQHPVLLAGMNVAAGPELAAAVTNAGGLGVIGGVGYTPKVLRQQVLSTIDGATSLTHVLENKIHSIKENLRNKDAPFGVDLLIPQVGGSARKTNSDYTRGQLPELVDVVIDEKAKLFVSAVGIPPKWAVDKLHQAGILVMNMVGHPKHVKRALDVGVDLICAQGGEGGGHTGEIAATILIPACVDAVKGHKSPLTGQPVYVIGAGAVFDGRGLAANLAWGAQAVWVGTRFVASTEAAAPPKHKELLVSAGFEDVLRTLIYTGRPMRVRKTPYIADWEENKQDEIKELTSKGIIPVAQDLEKHPEKSLESRPWLMGNVSSVISDILPAKTIVENMVTQAAEILQQQASRVISPIGAKL